jgi:cellulose synthase/poly-beta-1,6-N-acetylglucosamine synthase-like glycosyltransferase
LLSLTIFAAIVVVLYLALLMYWIVAWKRITPASIQNEASTFISVIVVFRNEAHNLQKLLVSFENLEYNKANFEIVMCNDQSTDNSINLITQYQKHSKLNIRLLPQIAVNESLSPKKRNMVWALEHAKGDIILCTDADCQVPRFWLQSITAPFAQKHIQMVAGPVSFFRPNSIFDHAQTVEFASLLGAGAASMAMNWPHMCNAANLAFRKAIFYAVDGYQGNLHLASGDDEFLMHKIHNTYRKSVFFQKSKLAIVTTNAVPSFGDFMQQRRRWASKWPHYRLWYIKILAVFVAMVQIAQIIIVFYAGYYQKWDSFSLLLLLKLLLEAYFLGSVLHFLGKSWSVVFIPLVQLFYPVYVLAAGFLSLNKKYAWKGRNYN